MLQINRYLGRAFSLAVVVTFLSLLFTGCPSEHGGKKSKINNDSILKAGKVFADSIKQQPPLTPIQISLDSLKKLLKVDQGVGEKQMLEWLYPPHYMTPLPPGPIETVPNCSLVPVFGDYEVSTLFNRVGREFPSDLYLEVGQAGICINGSQHFLVGPNIYTTPCDPRNSADLVQYAMSPNQVYRWSITTPSVRNLFMQALNAFQVAVQNPGTKHILTITNMQYGMPNSTPYIGVTYSTTVCTGSTKVHLIQLID